jgi:glycosyltransferase involved in cell wall biosynthesis
MLSPERALLVEPTAPALAAGIVRLLDDPSAAARLGEAARRWAEAELGWPAFVADVDQLYRDAGIRGEGRRAS